MFLPAPSLRLHPPPEVPGHTARQRQTSQRYLPLAQPKWGGKDAISFSRHTAAVIPKFDLHEDGQTY